MGRCGGLWGDVRRLFGGVTFVRKYGSSKGGVTCIRKVWQLMERCDGHGDVRGTGRCEV